MKSSVLIGWFPGLTPNNNHLVSESDMKKLPDVLENVCYTREELCAFSGIAEEDMTADMMKAVCMLMDQQKKAA